MILRIGDAAVAEALDAARWYDDQRPGLGAEFLAAITAAGDKILASPSAWPAWTGTGRHSSPVRRFVMKRFPFSLAFQVFGDTIEIVAVAHARRRPGYWRARARR